MPMPVINTAPRIRQIPTHSVELPDEARSPRLHFERSSNDVWTTLTYFERNLARVNVYQPASERHLHRLQDMVLLSFVEAFERFLKEIASVCIDQIAGLVLDDRLDVFSVRGNALAAHFADGTVGRSLCESSTWVDCDQANKRFRRILADPFTDGSFVLFDPKSDRYTLMEILWQIRHSIVHNAAVLTRSDVRKLERLTRLAVAGPRVLWPTKGDAWYVKLHLDRLVEEINREVATRLATLLSLLLFAEPGLFDPAEKAQNLADRFGLPITTGGATRAPA